MHVLSAIKTYLPKTETFVYNDYSELSRSGELSIIANEVRNSSLDYFPLPDGILHHLPFFYNSLDYYVRSSVIKRTVSYGYKSAVFAYRLTQLLDRIKPDLIYIHFGTLAPFIIYNLNHHHIPVLVQFHGYDASQMLNRKLYVKTLQNILSLANVYPVTVSDDMRHRLQESGIQGKKWYKLNSGIDSTFFKRSPDRTKSTQKTFLQVSSFREKKGHEYTLRAFSKFLEKSTDKDSILILAGDGPLLADIMRLCTELNLNEHVDFPGFVNRSQAKDLMQRASIFVHHSVTAKNGDMEGIPNAIMEAMSMELPVLSAFHSGIPELVENGVNGLLCNERDTDTFANQMHSIMSWDYVPESREKVIRQFEKNVHIANLKGIFKDVVSR